MEKRKTRILFTINNMEMGGTRSSLLNLLTLLKNYPLEIDLFLLSPFGLYRDSIPDNVNVIDSCLWYKCIFSKKEDLNFLEIVIKVFLHVVRRVIGYERMISLFSQNDEKINRNNYDVIVGYQEGESNDCAALFSSNKLLLWVHTDYSKLTGVAKGTYSSYQKAEKIIFVAETSKQAFQLEYPEFKGKCTVIKNTVNTKKVIENSQGVIEKLSKNTFRIVSIGRVTQAKRFDRIVDIVKKLKESDIDIEWLVIGDGELFGELSKNVSRDNLQDSIILMGAKENPYPYLLHSDLLVVTSDYEAQPMVILESLTLNVPIVTTRFDSVVELAQPCGQAIQIVDFSVEALAKKIKECMQPKIYDSMKLDAITFNYDNDTVMKQFMALVKE